MNGFWWSIIGLLTLVSIITRNNLLFLMSLLLALVGGMAILWTHYCLAGVSYRRRFGSARLFYGEETDLYVEITNAKPMPLSWLGIADEVPADVEFIAGQLGYSHRPRRQRLLNLLSLRWYERVTHHYRVRGLQRGAWQFGPVQLESGDLFGFGYQSEELPEVQTLLVYPKVVPITALGLPANDPFGDFKTGRQVMADPLRVIGAREYHPGDNFRHVHWKATARRRELQTKIFEPSATRRLAIFLNINTFGYLYEGLDVTLREFAVTAAASIARYACEAGYQTGLYVNSVTQPGGQRVRIRPGNHPDQLTRIWEGLARMVDYGAWPIQTILQVEVERLRYGTTLVVVTPRLDEGLHRTILELQHRGHRIVLIGLGPAHLDTPLPGVQYYYIGGREAWDALASLELA